MIFDHQQRKDQARTHQATNLRTPIKPKNPPINRKNHNTPNKQTIQEHNHSPQNQHPHPHQNNSKTNKNGSVTDLSKKHGADRGGGSPAEDGIWIL